jgi:hypothetical protein
MILTTPYQRPCAATLCARIYPAVLRRASFLRMSV